MLSIGNFFDKFRNVAVKEIALRQSIIDAITKNISHGTHSIGLNIEDIDVRNKIVRIHAGPGLKNQIFIKKESILKSIQESNPHIIITDVR